MKSLNGSLAAAREPRYVNLQMNKRFVEVSISESHTYHSGYLIYVYISCYFIFLNPIDFVKFVNSFVLG